jgi:3-dehydroquinate synthase
MKIARFKFSSAVTTVHFNSSISRLAKLAGKSRAIIITDENVYAAHSGKLRGWDVIVLKTGEEFKVQETVDAVLMQLIRMEADRETLLVGVGGGVITDLTGFVAAIYMRGLAFGFVPTSLLALVDAAIGGKNGIDVGPYKNMVGTIRQPAFILHDLSLLNSLPETEWRNGMAEVVKHACIHNRLMFDKLKVLTIPALRRNRKKLSDLVFENATFKLKLVQRDEWERGERKKLNFGHTLGHAIENQYEISHGEAISIGMMAACRISEEILGFHEKEEVKMLLEKFGLPTSALYNREKIFQVLAMDKKRQGATIQFILLKKIGRAQIQKIPLARLKTYLEQK